MRFFGPCTMRTESRIGGRLLGDRQRSGGMYSCAVGGQRISLEKVPGGGRRAGAAGPARGRGAGRPFQAGAGVGRACGRERRFAGGPGRPAGRGQAGFHQHAGEADLRGHRFLVRPLLPHGRHHRAAVRREHWRERRIPGILRPRGIRWQPRVLSKRRAAFRAGHRQLPGRLHARGQHHHADLDGQWSGRLRRVRQLLRRHLDRRHARLLQHARRAGRCRQRPGV